jgi:hypothetical protein
VTDGWEETTVKDASNSVVVLILITCVRPFRQILNGMFSNTSNIYNVKASNMSNAIITFHFYIFNSPRYKNLRAYARGALVGKTTR